MQVSPDGKLAAFASEEGGGSDVWIRGYPVPQGQWRVSSSELSFWPRWTRDGNHVFFVRGSSAGPDTIFRARIERRPSVVVHPQERILAQDIPGQENWDLHPDGKRIGVAVSADRGPASPTAGGSATAQASRYVFVQNWFTELKRLTSRATQ